MADTGFIITQGLPLDELFAVGADDHVVTVPVSSVLPDQSGHAGEFLTTNGSVLSWAAVSGGSGTVTTVSVVTANGVSGSVANPTTTPAITLTLGAITPTSINASGTVTGSNLSGTNTGDQTITLTSDVTGTGTGSFATTIANNAVTYAKMQAVSGTSKILGSSSTTTSVQELSLGSGLSLTGTTLSATGTGGTVTSVDVSGGTTGLTTSGGPVTTTGAITIAGTLAIANGGTGQVTANAALNALLPSQGGNSGKFLKTNATDSSWSSLTGLFTQTNVDMNTAGVGSTVIDDNVADTLIVDTTKPANPQYTRTIVSGDFPTNTSVAEWFVVVSIGGKNLDAVNSRTINWRFTLNGTDIGSADSSRAITGNQFWYATGLFFASAIVANDVIGVKMWGSVANNLDYRYVTIYLIPRIISPATGGLLFYDHKSGTTTRSALNGAVTGVTYTSAGTLTPTMGDRNLNVLLSAVGNNTINVVSPAQGIYGNGALTSDNNFAQGTNSGAMLSGITTNQLIRYYQTFAVTVT